MGFFVDRRKVYRIEVESPEDPETGEIQSAWVDLRKMTEGDIQDRNDIATQIRAEQRQQRRRQLKGHLSKGGRRRRRGGQVETDDASMQYALGALRGFDLVRSIVDWNLVDPENRRVPPTPDNIKALDPYTAQQIHDEIAIINPSIFPGQAESEAEETEEGYGLEYDEDETREVDEADSEADFEPANADDELYGPDEDAPPEAGGVAGTGADPGDLEDEEVDPTRTISGNRR